MPWPSASSGRGRRIEGLLARTAHSRARPRGSVGEGDGAADARRSSTQTLPASNVIARVRRRHWRGAGSSARSASAGELRRLAGDEGLARGGGLAAIGRQVGVGGDEVDRGERHAERVGADLGDDGVRSPGRYRPRPDAARAARRGFRPTRMVEGLGSEVLPQPYHMPATPAPRRSGPSPRALRSRGLRSAPASNAAAAPRGRRGCRRRRRAPGRSRSAGRAPSALRMRNSSGSMPSSVGELVIELLLGDRRLRHAEAAEGAGRHEMRVDGAGQGAVMRHDSRGRRRGPARGWRPSVPRRHRRRC